MWVCTKAGNWHLGKVVSKPREANVKEASSGSGENKKFTSSHFRRTLLVRSGW